MEKLAILTPTYNRGYILGNAYESLKNQTVKDFEWIIVDDGSTDGTDELVASWISEQKSFEIKYSKQEHIGMPRALNEGVKLASSDWILKLDSDDRIVPNAVELSLKWLAEIENEKYIGGIGFVKSFPDGKYMKDQTPIIDPVLGYVDATHIERAKYNLDMDMCEIHRTELFRKYPFQCWPNEMFAPEQLNFNCIALAGWKLRWRDEKLYLCDYLPDGLTKDNRIVKQNPMGYAMMHNQNLLLHHTFRQQFYDAVQLVSLCLYAKQFNYLFKSNKKVITSIAFPLGVILGIRRWYQFRKMK